jgi:4-alpha-glucanotransferase
MPETLEQFIQIAQEEAGVEDHYWDLWGQRHETTAEAAGALLHAFGYDVSSAEALKASLASRRAEQAALLLPETIVVRVSEWPLKLPVNAEGGYQLRVLMEGGTGEVASVRWSDTPVVPEPLPLGYHRVEISSGGREQTANLIVCPDRAYLPPDETAKFAGLGVFLPGVRDQGTWGCGDFRALGRLSEWAARTMNVSYIALNPLHAIHNRAPFNTSPYLPDSLLYRNFIYLDIESLPDFAECLPAVRLRAADRIQREIGKLNQSDLVDYDGVARIKRVFLLHLFRSFWRRHWRYGMGTERGEAFQEFLLRGGQALHRYSLHCALDRHFHRQNKDVWNWPAWPEAYQRPDSEACSAFAASHQRTCLFYSWVQWQIDEQLGQVQQQAKAAGMPIGLFHDLPLATDRAGAELWGHREFYLSSGGVGAPPDAIAPQGQDWGFPPPNREAHRRSGYQHFANTIRSAVRHGGALRMDHVMRLFRLYTIPPGKTAMDGVYVRDYAQDLLGILALESVRNQAIIVGEDLGTVAPGVRESLHENGILSYRLLYFEREGETYRLPHEYLRQALVSTTTHDLPTIAGFWAGRDIRIRRQIGLINGQDGFDHEIRERTAAKQGILDALFAAQLLPETHGRDVAFYPELTGDLHNAMIGFLASTPSLLLTVNQEDLTKDPDQQNLPGTVSDYPNWRRKMRMTLDQLLSDGAYTTMLRNWIHQTGRAPRT